jgi:hypothetical protein
MKDLLIIYNLIGGRFMLVPDVRFGEGYENLKTMLDSLLDKFNIKELQEMTKALYTELEYYRSMEEFHAPIGLTDDARRVRRLEKEISKVRQTLNEFPFLELGVDGSIILKDKASIEIIEGLFNKFDQRNEKSISSIEETLENLVNRVEEIKKKDSQPSLIITILIGLLINFISSLIQSGTPDVNNTYLLNNVQNTQVTVFNLEVNQEDLIVCNDLDVFESPSKESKVLKRINGIRNMKFMEFHNKWINIEYIEGAEKISGWIDTENLRNVISTLQR